MKLFYVATPEAAKAIPTGWHSVDLGNGKLLVCVDWRNQAHEEVWAARDDVICLPHPIFEANDGLTAEHREHLSGRFTVNHGDNVHAVIKQAAVIDRWMRLRVL
jgi:hypothetical protein